MGAVMLTTAGHPWVKLRATNFTDADFAATAPRVGRPSGDNVIPMRKAGAAGSPVQNAILLKFFGADAANETYNVRLLGWDAVPNAKQDNHDTPYDFILLCQLAITLGNLAGVANTAITGNDFEADTVAVTYGNDDIDVSHNSNGADVRGVYVRADTMGCELVQIDFDMGTAASGNCLYKLL